MCRLAAYLGPKRPISDVVVTPTHSLLAQSQEAQEAKLLVNGDGFGIAWYGDRPDTALFKDVLPAWSDENLLNLYNHVSSSLFLAHVRASTGGETMRANCHPFVDGDWSFMHNGQIGCFPALRRKLEAHLSDKVYAKRRGNTDSELLFLLLLDAGLADDAERACAKVIEQLYEAARDAFVAPFFRLTCVFSDGAQLFCFRHASDGRCPTLYGSTCFLNGGRVIASEPLDGLPARWYEITPDCLVRYGSGDQPFLSDLRAA